MASDDTLQQLAEVQADVARLAASNPQAVIIAALEVLIEIAAGANPSLRDAGEARAAMSARKEQSYSALVDNRGRLLPPGRARLEEIRRALDDVLGGAHDDNTGPCAGLICAATTAAVSATSSRTYCEPRATSNGCQRATKERIRIGPTGIGFMIRITGLGALPLVRSGVDPPLSRDTTTSSRMLAMSLDLQGDKTAGFGADRPVSGGRRCQLVAVDGSERQQIRCQNLGPKDRGARWYP